MDNLKFEISDIFPQLDTSFIESVIEVNGINLEKCVDCITNQEPIKQKVEKPVRMECPLCITVVNLSSIYVLDECDHKFCHECLGNYLNSKIESRDLNPIKCPNSPDCKSNMKFNEVKQILKPEKFERFDSLLVELNLSQDPNCVFCPRPNCGNAMIRWKDSDIMMICPNTKCNFSFCFNCKEAWHSDVTCENYQKWKQENSNNGISFQTWASQNAKPCPNCKVLINKNGGCNHMTVCLNYF